MSLQRGNVQKENEINKAKIIRHYVHMFHIKHLLKSKIQMLSGGEKQKIALIEALRIKVF